ncbi:hypothetical protein ACR6C2_08150 [Streptomyces sp. INA 01156]
MRYRTVAPPSRRGWIAYPRLLARRRRSRAPGSLTVPVVVLSGLSTVSVNTAATP